MSYNRHCVQEFGFSAAEINLFISTMAGLHPHTDGPVTSEWLYVMLWTAADESRKGYDAFKIDLSAANDLPDRSFRLRSLAQKVKKLHDDQAQALCFYVAGFVAGTTNARDS
jgi:hypothetical protein